MGLLPPGSHYRLIESAVLGPQPLPLGEAGSDQGSLHGRAGQGAIFAFKNMGFRGAVTPLDDVLMETVEGAVVAPITSGIVFTLVNG